MTIGRILVVEDDDLLREALAEVLADDGHDVRMARNGAEGLEALEDWGPELIVLDLMMPVMDGFAFRLEQARRGLSPDVPVLVLSAARDLDVAAQRIGATASVPKPFRLDEVLAEVEKLLASRHGTEGRSSVTTHGASSA
jgi:two-component system, chemotaxis family, chemotaxis protein CheY